jgi:hypothetical protein
MTNHFHNNPYLDSSVNPDPRYESLQSIECRDTVVEQCESLIFNLRRSGVASRRTPNQANLSEFTETHLIFTAAFPHLFPFGPNLDLIKDDVGLLTSEFVRPEFMCNTRIPVKKKKRRTVEEIEAEVEDEGAVAASGAGAGAEEPPGFTLRANTGFPVKNSISRKFALSLFHHASGIITRDETFLFLVCASRRFSIISQTVKANPAAVQRFNTFLGIEMRSRNFETVDQVLRDMAKELYENPSSDRSAKIRSQLSAVGRMASRPFAGSDGEKRKLKNNYAAATDFLGPPTFHLTLSPTPYDSPEAFKLTGKFGNGVESKEIDLTKFSRDARKGYWYREPKTAALFFNTIVKHVLQDLLKVSDGVPDALRFKKEIGVLGDAYAYCGTVETQQRGLLHAHFMVWTKLSNDDIVFEFAERFSDKTFVEELYQFVEATTSCGTSFELWKSFLLDKPILKAQKLLTDEQKAQCAKEAEQFKQNF